MEIFFLTSNKHKYEEARQIAEAYNVSLKLLNLPKIEIQSEKLEDIVNYALLNVKTSISPILVEDAGLFIDALKGFPGPYSSYVFKKIGNLGILKLLEGIDHRSASFVSVVGLRTKKGSIVIFKGVTEGHIALSERGSRGFGYDPIFIPKCCSKTYAEMSINEKNEISHRSKAFRKALDWIINNFYDI